MYAYECTFGCVWLYGVPCVLFVNPEQLCVACSKYGEGTPFLSEAFRDLIPLALWDRWHRACTEQNYKVCSVVVFRASRTCVGMVWV
jgi:hypothetical protein